ncbi:hypothetical protein [Nonomuraea sp. CA-141351]|uniref:hypothetical protein n=1 Tax=Nonomuraea sp. CA-141351 TaxID=3239996 RepID=UPI003D8E5593
MPRRYNRSWLACVLATAASWMFSVAAVVGAAPLAGDELLLIAVWLVTAAMPVTKLAAQLYPVQRRTIAAYRAYRLGVLHAEENYAAHAAERMTCKY